MGRKTLLWLLLNALLWTAFGAAGTWIVARLRGQRPTIGDLADEALVRMDSLGLTLDQRKQLATIREQWKTQMVAEERAWLAKLDAAAADADAKVAALLTPDQSRRYRELALGAGSK
jgi:malic enzyme